MSANINDPRYRDPKGMIVITSPAFMVGVKFKPSGNECPPVVKWMRTMSKAQVVAFCKQQNWKVEELK